MAKLLNTASDGLIYVLWAMQKWYMQNDLCSSCVSQRRRVTLANSLVLSLWIYTRVSVTSSRSCRCAIPSLVHAVLLFILFKITKEIAFAAFAYVAQTHTDAQSHLRYVCFDVFGYLDVWNHSAYLKYVWYKHDAV